MKQNNIDRTANIDRYIKEISEFFPYPSSLKNKLLVELRIDVQAAMNESESKNPSMVFGLPRDVAKNFTKGQDWGTERAGWWSRIFAYLIDIVVLGLFVLFYAGGGILAILALFFPIDQIPELFIGSWGFDEPMTLDLNLSLMEMILFLTLLFFLIGSAILIALGYLVALERYYSTTIGKKLLKLSVVDISGIRITWQQAIIRNVSKIFGGFLPFDLLLGLILEKQNPEKTRKQRSFDILAETIVVKRK